MLEESSIVGYHPQRWHSKAQSCNPRSQVSTNTITNTSLCDHGVHNPCGFQEELKLQTTVELGNGELNMENKSTMHNQAVRMEEGTLTTVKEFIKRKQQHAMIACADDYGNFQANAVMASAFVTLLKTCANEKDLCNGSSTHSELIRRGLAAESNVFMGSALINMYAKCGKLEKAQQVFDELYVRNVVTWNALIAGYAQHGHGEEALECFEQMQRRGFSPSVVTYICTLKACGSIGDSDKGQDIHAQILREHLLEDHVEVANALVDMYAKCGELDTAREVFNELPVKSVVSWTALITGYAQHGYCTEALCTFEQMQMCGFSPDAFTVPSILKACGGVGAFSKGQELHAWTLRAGLLVQDVVITNALIDMYAKCGALNIAQEVFDELPVRNIISWNTLIDGYAQLGHSREALSCVEHMQVDGFSPDAATFVCILKACASAKALDAGQKLHACVMTEPFLVADTALGNAIIDMYAKCGALEEAQDVFDELPARDTVSWNTLIIGYDQNNHNEDAMAYFKQMQLEGFSPDVVTSICIFRVCGSLGAACKGQELYSEIVKLGSLENVMVVGIALIGMYASCGMLIEAQYLFDKLPVQDVISWSALLEGFTQLGKYEVVFNLFDTMVGRGLKPNSVTFLILLNACSHGGLVDKGQTFFQFIIRSFGIVPNVEHYACKVDLLCRAGNIDSAVALIEEMQFSADGTIWHSLLVACQERGNRKLGKWAFEGAVHANEKDAAAYVCMSKMQA